MDAKNTHLLNAKPGKQNQAENDYQSDNKQVLAIEKTAEKDSGEHCSKVHNTNDNELILDDSVEESGKEQAQGSGIDEDMHNTVGLDHSPSCVIETRNSLDSVVDSLKAVVM